jgi:uncharacterized protein (DUF885 family)
MKPHLSMFRTPFEITANRFVYALALIAVLLTSFTTPALSQAATSGQPQTADVESERLRTWFDAKYEERLQLRPLLLTQLGRKDRYGELDDFSLESEDAELAWHRATVEELEHSFDYDARGPADRLSYDLWKHNFERHAELVRWRGNAYVFSPHAWSVHTALPRNMITLHRVDTEQDMRDYIARVGQFDRAIGQLVVRAEANAARGVRPPYFAYDIVIAEAGKLIDGAPFTSGADTALWQDGKAKIAALVAAGKIDETRATSLQEELSAALTNSYLPGYQRLIAFMQRDQPNAPPVATGVGALPEGDAYYASQLRGMTTTNLTADQIHQLGLDEVDRIRVEMKAIKDSVGFEGDLEAFFEHVRTADWNYFPEGDEGAQAYIDAAKAAIDTIKRELPNYFGLLPKADLEVRRVEPFREQDGGVLHYVPGTADGSRPGIFYAHLSNMRANPKNMLEVGAYHEGLPGHHMQASIQRELEGVPDFRTQLAIPRYGGYVESPYTAYTEGWALYAEKLAKEIPNTYTDPYSDFGRLSSELWRAIRLVIDTGLHWKGWTEAEANQYFRENSGMPLEVIRSEVRRYIVRPGQATTYKIGMICIQQLRAEAETELGAAFDIRAFHDVVLGGGSMPLQLLEQRVRGWIAERKGR